MPGYRLLRPVYKAAKQIPNLVAEATNGALWDPYTTFRGRFGNYSDNLFTNMYATAARRYGLPDKARIPADAMRKIRTTQGEIVADKNGLIDLTGNKFYNGRPHINVTTDRPVVSHKVSGWDGSDMYIFPTKDFLRQTMKDKSLVSIEPSDMFANGTSIVEPAKRVTFVSGDIEALRKARKAGMQTLSSPKLRRMYKERVNAYNQDMTDYTNRIAGKSGFALKTEKPPKPPKFQSYWQDYANEMQRLQSQRGTPTLADYKLMENQTGLKTGVVPIEKYQNAISGIDLMRHGNPFTGAAKAYVYPNGREIDWSVNKIKHEINYLTKAKYNHVFYDPVSDAESKWKRSNGISEH